MQTMTITEALAEIKTIGKRLEKKRAFVEQFLARQEGLKDPLSREGGSVEALRETRQSIDALEERIIRIRRSIAKANDVVELSVGGRSRTIAEWLIWRREVASGRTQFLTRLQNAIGSVRSQAKQKGWNVVRAEGEAQAQTDFIVNIDERALSAEIELMEEILGSLDGQLSLKNATTMVEVAE